MGGPLRTRLVSPLLCFMISSGMVLAQAPGEVQGLVLSDPSSLVWSATAGADFYNVYRGTLSELAAGNPGRCHEYEIGSTSLTTVSNPEAGDGFFFLVTAESAVGGEGTPGNESSGAPRPLLGSCGPVMRTHLLDRTGFGWNEWTRDRVATLGLQGYIQEQLDPTLISEVDNTELNNGLAPFTPPLDIVHLISRQVVSAVYARRQLEQQYATFWTNHFNTDWAKAANIFLGVYPDCASMLPQCDPNFPAEAYYQATSAQFDEMEDFRNLGFNGNFLEILQTSALSPAMILFLDLYANVATAPNENYSRELLELYSMGVNGGYTQTDVEELARALTGWTICKKATADVGDPLAPCIANYWAPTPVGEWTAHFDPNQHDCTEKNLFTGTPYHVMIKDTCTTPTAGMNDLFNALLTITAHPSTAEFISGKILERFVTEDPDQALVDQLVAVWNDSSNPNGVGDLRAVLDAALALPEFLDADRVKTKVKTPMEHFASAFRATRGSTDGFTGVLFNYLIDSQHLPHFNPVPTGYTEVGAGWIDTSNMLQRQNFGIDLLQQTSTFFGSDPISLLNDNGISTTTPGNSQAIVDFFLDNLFGGAVTPAERQVAIDFLDTDELGVPSPYDDLRIREAVALMLGWPQFQEQ